jgi:hypothetical protein
VQTWRELPLTSVALVSDAAKAQRTRFSANSHDVPSELCLASSPLCPAAAAGAFVGRAHPLRGNRRAATTRRKADLLARRWPADKPRGRGLRHGDVRPPPAPIVRRIVAAAGEFVMTGSGGIDELGTKKKIKFCAAEIARRWPS